MDDVNLSYKINEIEYKFLFCTSFDFERAHLTASFNFNDTFYLVDDLRNELNKKIPDDFLPTTTITYITTTTTIFYGINEINKNLYSLNIFHHINFKY